MPRMEKGASLFRCCSDVRHKYLLIKLFTKVNINHIRVRVHVRVRVRDIVRVCVSLYVLVRHAIGRSNSTPDRCVRYGTVPSLT